MKLNDYVMVFVLFAMLTMAFHFERKDRKRDVDIIQQQILDVLDINMEQLKLIKYLYESRL